MCMKSEVIRVVPGASLQLNLVHVSSIIRRFLIERNLVIHQRKTHVDASDNSKAHTYLFDTSNYLVSNLAPTSFPTGNDINDYAKRK